MAMTIEEQLRELMTVKDGSVNAFAKSAGFKTPSTVYSVLERGVMNASVDTMIKICKHLKISLDGVGAGKIVSSEKLELTPAEVELVKTYRQLDVRGQHAVEDTAKRELSYSQPLKEESKVATSVG